MIRPHATSPASSSGFLKPPELPRLPTAPSTGFTLDLPSSGLPSSGQSRPDGSSLEIAPAALAKWSIKNEQALQAAQSGEEPLREAFRDFVGQTLFGQMLASMRSTVGKPAYFHGGRAEEVFSQQLDQVLVEKITDASASTVADPMYDLFNMQRSQ